MVPAKFTHGGIETRSLSELTNFVSMLKKAPDFLPKAKRGYTVEELIINIQYGLEIGLSVMQSIQGVAVISGTPTLWGDNLVGVVHASGKMAHFSERIEGEFPNDDCTYFCEVGRINSGNMLKIERSFSIKDAKKANLWSKQIWQAYPKRMLTMRARSWAIRDMFADVTRGFVATEEAVDYEKTVNPTIVESFGPKGKEVSSTENVSIDLETTVIEALNKIRITDDEMSEKIVSVYKDFKDNDDNTNIVNDFVSYLEDVASSAGLDLKKVTDKASGNVLKALESFIIHQNK